MTPEERADTLLTRLACNRGQRIGWDVGIESLWLAEQIAAAIREAVEAEREAWISNAASTAVTPKRMREMGMSDGWDEKYSAAHSNAIYFLLSSMGLSLDEIRKRFNDAG